MLNRFLGVDDGASQGCPTYPSLGRRATPGVDTSRLANQLRDLQLIAYVFDSSDVPGIVTCGSLDKWRGNLARQNNNAVLGIDADVIVLRVRIFPKPIHHNRLDITVGHLLI